ncbi:hypothetical protein J7M28_02275 [bacterium]|nr:hypothetical protein [bacterium]
MHTINRYCVVLLFVASLSLLSSVESWGSQDMFTYSYFHYTDDDDTDQDAMAFRLEKQIIEWTKIKASYIHSDIKYFNTEFGSWQGDKKPFYSHGDQYSLQVEQKTFKEGKVVLGYTFSEAAMRLTDAYLMHEMEDKLGKIRKPSSNSYNISYSQPLFEQNTTIEAAYSYIDAKLTPYWEYSLFTNDWEGDRTTSYTNSVSLTVTQILTEYTMCQLSASYATQSDLPATWDFSAKLNQYLPTRTSIQGYYRYSEDGDRFYSDTFEVKAYQYILQDITLLARYRMHKEHDSSLNEEQEEVYHIREDGAAGDLSVGLFPTNSDTVGGGLILDVLNLAGAPAWMGGNHLDKINLDVRYDHYHTNHGLKADMYLAGLAFLF